MHEDGHEAEPTVLGRASEPPGTEGPPRRAAGDIPRTGDEGGEPACLLARVCPDCGRLADEDPPTVCPGCGGEVG